MNKNNKKLNHVTLRLEPELTEKIDVLSSYEDIDKSALYRQAVKKGIKEISKEVAIKLYADGEIGISRAAHMAGIYIGDFMELVAKRGIGSNITEEQYRLAEKNAHEFFQKVLKSKENEKESQHHPEASYSSRIASRNLHVLNDSGKASYKAKPKTSLKKK
jgi:predicted HTH domain antitoxin